MLWRKFVKDYFTFGKKDRIGIFSLLGLGLLIYFLPYFFKSTTDQAVLKEGTVLAKAIDTSAEWHRNKSENQNEETAESHQFEPSQMKNFPGGVLFQFDPNTLSIEGWQKLGLNEKTSKTIGRYISKGGKFYKPEDLKKIWGLPEGFYERVKNYIVIAPIQDNYSKNDFEKATYTKPGKKAVIVNINEADTSALIALPGIGSKLAARIVNFREKLGGFYSIEQIGETYGLPDSTFQKIKGSLQLDGPVKKINVNIATKDELKLHPYIRWNLANIIVEYRNQHGSFKSLEELKNIAVIDEATFMKIAPYLSL